MTNIEDNRTRYELLFDRRRALRELERLASSLAERDDYDLLRVNEIMMDVKGKLGAGTHQAACAVLLRDVRTIYRGLVELSRLWLGYAEEPAAGLDSRK